MTTVNEQEQSVRFVKAGPTERPCLSAFMDADSRRWTCLRAAHASRQSHASFLDDGTVACIEGQRPVWIPVTARHTSSQDARHRATLQVGLDEARQARINYQTALARLDVERAHAGELQAAFEILAHRVYAHRAQLRTIQAAHTGLRANVRDVLAAIAGLQQPGVIDGMASYRRADLAIITRKLDQILAKLEVPVDVD